MHIYIYIYIYICMYKYKQLLIGYYIYIYTLCIYKQLYIRIIGYEDFFLIFLVQNKGKEQLRCVTTHQKVEHGHSGV